MDKNKKTVLENTMADAVTKFIQEAVEPAEEEDDSAYEEEDVDAETGEALDDEEMEDDSDDEEIEIEDDSDEEEIDVDMEDEDMEDEDMEDDDMEDDDMEDDDEVIDIDMEDEDMEDSEMDMGDDEGMDFEGSEEESVDMTQASLEEVMEFIENADDDVVFQIVKKPTYSVTTNSSQGAPMGAGMSMGTEGSDEEDIELDIDEETLMEMLRDEMSEVEQMPVYKQGETVPKFQKGQSVGITDGEGNVKVVAENRKLKAQVNKLVQENKQLKLNETKSIAALKQMISKANELALVNTNLAYVSRLFTEHSTTKPEKVAILKKFDAAKTVNESEKTFKVLTEALGKRTQKKAISVNVNEAVDFNQKKVIKEEKAYVDPVEEKMMRLFNFKSGL
jgi:segregation and condensation protein B